MKLVEFLKFIFRLDVFCVCACRRFVKKLGESQIYFLILFGCQRVFLDQTNTLKCETTPPTPSRFMAEVVCNCDVYVYVYVCVCVCVGGGVFEPGEVLTKFRSEKGYIYSISRGF